ncbi:respiratory nitrate reductase subunit gamma [Salinibacillus aidingensis]
MVCRPATSFITAIPFTKLVHFYSLPLGYLHRAPQQYRSRVGFRRKGLE